MSVHYLVKEKFYFCEKVLI